jgi:hypothetical protein
VTGVKQRGKAGERRLARTAPAGLRSVTGSRQRVGAVALQAQQGDPLYVVAGELPQQPGQLVLQRGDLVGRKLVVGQVV